MASVSVVLPVRDGEAFLAAALASVVRQTRPVAEILLVDGQSTDATRRIASGFPGVTWLDQRGPNLSSAYNEGIERSRGELLAFHCHDDLWLPRKIELQVARLAADDRIDYVLCRTEIFVEPGTIPPPGARTELAGRSACLRLLEALLVRREVAQANGPFREDLAPSGDTDWLSRLEDSGARGVYVEETLLRRRIHPGSTSCSPTVGKDFLPRILRESILRKRAVRSGTG